MFAKAGEMMNIKGIRTTTIMSQSEFANYFNIPVKTIQKWERNGSNPPPYISEMMMQILKLEKQQ